MQHQTQHNNQQIQTRTSCCYAPPSVLFLLVTLLMTTAATAMLCGSIMTDHWEEVRWDRNSLMNIVNNSKSSKHVNKLEWVLDEKVARLPLKGKYLR